MPAHAVQKGRLPATFLLSILVLLPLTACDTTPRSAGAGGSLTSTQNPRSPKQHDPALDENNPCVKNLERVIESLLLYVSVYHRLPASLADAQPLSIGDDSFAQACPQSKKPYQYFGPKGLSAPESVLPSRIRILLMDPEPTHPIRQTLSDGKYDYDYLRTVRYGIAFAPLSPGEPVQMFVIPIDENLLKLYK